MPDTIHEPARAVPVIHECDICVLGGSCTGVFAAVRAARLGARVVIVEKAGSFGGMATQALVNVWHSRFDTEYRQQIIGGLTVELMDRLKQRGAVVEHPNNASLGWTFNPQEMQIELDEFVQENRIAPLLHTLFVAPHVVDGRLDAVVIENKSGRSAIRAKVFIDATGDGDLCQRLGLAMYRVEHLQPSTLCAVFSGWETSSKTHVVSLMREHGASVNLPQGFVWGAGIPGSSLYMLAGTRVYGVDCSVAADLTRAMMEGRRQIRAIMDLIRQHVPDQEVTLQALPASIGIRQTKQVRCKHQLTGEEVLTGKRFDDAIANGSYRVDVHHQEKPGLTFKYLDGTQVYSRPGYPEERSRWRPESATDPTFYQVPLRSLLPQDGPPNLIVAGRMLDADVEAFAAVRVMVNLNQTGEAAGVAAALALNANGDIHAVPASRVRSTLAQGGSVIL